MLKAILMDVGGVILNEDELYEAYFKYLKEKLRESGVGFTDMEFKKAVEQCILNFEPHFTKALVYSFIERGEKRCDDILSAANRYVKDWVAKHRQKLNPGINEVLKKISKDYMLALAGNQPSAVKELLKAHGLLGFFTTTEVSEDIGKAKPDPDFFKYILKKLDVEAFEAVMIGDRLDNDIIPAKKLGMMTILVKSGAYAILEPRNPGEIADAVVRTVSELPGAVADIVRQNA
jgi:HAD superfamily hydrolase (TIGR01549 family)